MKLIASQAAQDEIARYLRKMADEINNGEVFVEDLSLSRGVEEAAGDGPFREFRPSGREKIKLRISRFARS